MTPLTPAQRSVLRAAGQLGGLTGRKTTAPATRARLLKLGAALAADGTLDETSPATAQARRRMAAAARLGRAQAVVARQKRQAPR